MPSNIKPLRDTEYKYRDERDVGQRKIKPTLETDTPRPSPQVEAPASTTPSDPKSTQSEPEPTTDQPSQELTRARVTLSPTTLVTTLATTQTYQHVRNKAIKVRTQLANIVTPILSMPPS